jgi:hypothetical protein
LAGFEVTTEEQIELSGDQIKFLDGYFVALAPLNGRFQPLEVGLMLLRVSLSISQCHFGSTHKFGPSRTRVCNDCAKFRDACKQGRIRKGFVFR